MRLRGIDASFLYAETPQAPMHVAGFTLFDVPEHQRGRFYQAYRDFLSQRIGAAPLFTRKLRPTPLQLDHPSWIEDDAFDLDHHLRGLELPPPGSMAQMEEAVARLHGELLDRTRPLWQFTIIEGLADGRAALYSKVHHAALDGAAGMVLTKAMYDVTPQPRPANLLGEILRPPPAPASTDLLGGLRDLAMNTIRQQVETVRRLPDVLKAVNNVLLPPLAEDATLADLIPVRSLSRLPRLAAPRTPFNVQISGERAYAARALPLATAKRLAKATGTKLNDVVMAVCAGALRRYLQQHDALPKRELVAFVPVSLRELGNTDMNNQVSGMLCGLATDVAEPLARLRQIARAATEAKSLTADIKDAMPQDYAFLGAPVILSALARLYGGSGAANWVASPVNVVISNVQGPPVPLFCGEARVAGLYPVSIPAHGTALNLTVQSYIGELDFGLTADRRAVPDLAFLADALAPALEELVEEAGLAAPEEEPQVVKMPKRRAEQAAS